MAMANPGGDDAGKAARTERLAARLRENLKRRKAQSRSRRSGDVDPRSGLEAGDEAESGREDGVANPPESSDDLSR